MSERTIQPICAFDIGKDGKPVPINSTWPSVKAGTDVAYRWLHFDTAEDALGIWTKEFLPSSAHTALRQAETRPRCTHVEDGLILNLRGVNLNPGEMADDMVSLRFWVTKGLVVSARMRKVFALDEIRQKMENGEGPKSVDLFLADLTFGLTQRIERIALKLEEEADAIEEDALARPQDTNEKLTQCRQSVIKLRRFIRPQKEAVVALADNQAWSLESRAAALLSETANKITRSVEALDATHDRLLATQDHLDILHASTLGRNSYVLSVVAAIFLPLGFLTGLFGINVGGMPGVESSMGFWIVTGGSAVIGIALFAIFRFAKWL
ncbi:zinc transporter ZntB [Rhodobacteraceae bacterium]|nr:zinc transporter ZntB [Paracoccaceae bacterium]